MSSHSKSGLKRAIASGFIILSSFFTYNSVPSKVSPPVPQSNLEALADSPSRVSANNLNAAESPQSPAYLVLPDGFGNSEEEEEDPEIIEFYGDTYEADAFFFCLDRSSSMNGQTASGEQKFAVLKRETIKALQGLTSRSKATVTFYNRDRDPLTYGDPPVQMDAAGKAKMIGDVMGAPISTGSCMSNGMEKTLNIANSLKKVDYRAILLVGDGMTQCTTGATGPEPVYQRISGKNTQKIPINTIYTGPQSGEEWNTGKPLLERIARSSNGKFKIAR
jgi:hypothetical protein